MGTRWRPRSERALCPRLSPAGRWTARTLREMILCYYTFLRLAPALPVQGANASAYGPDATDLHRLVGESRLAHSLRTAAVQCMKNFCLLRTPSSASAYALCFRHYDYLRHKIYAAPSCRARRWIVRKTIRRLLERICSEKSAPACVAMHSRPSGIA